MQAPEQGENGLQVNRDIKHGLENTTGPDEQDDFIGLNCPKC